MNIVCFVIILQFVTFTLTTNPCEITSGYGSKSARIEFDENTSVNTTLFKLPFEGDEDEIEEISLSSSELNESQLAQYFRLKFNKLILRSHYDLDKIELDFVELLFTCTSKANKKTNAKFRNTFLLYITINDINDKTPEFIGTPYKFSLKELTPIGTIVYQNIKAIDRDMANRPNSQISFSIERGPFSDYFEFPLTTKSEIAVSKLIHYDLFSKYNLTIIAQDHGEPQLSSKTTIEITIIDIDDKDPVFTSNFYKGYVIRNDRPGSFVNMTSESILAYDQDVGINMNVKYSLNTNPEDLFEINEDSGLIKLKHSITDYDKFEYNVVVKATQVDNPLRSAMSMVSISIIDLNEHAPKFESNLYEASIYENAKLDTIVCVTHATDKDKNRIEYSILNNHESPFLIDKYKGVIKVNGRLDYEMKSKYIIEVLAKDANFSDKTLVKINILNLIDKAPYFEYNYYNFKIKIPYDVYIGQIKATDVENTGNMSYSMKFNDPSHSKLFCITQTGTIYICSSVISPMHSSAGVEDILAQFIQDEYKFSVHVSIYSEDLKQDLENSVECRIQIESKKIISVTSRNADGFNMTTATSPIQPIVFFKDHLFKDISNLNVFVLIIALVLIFLTFCFAFLLWFKCRLRTKQEKHIKRALSNRLEFGMYQNNPQKLVNSSTCSRASSDRGISCSSACSNFKSSENSPISKATILTDYLQPKNDQIRLSCYSDLLSSTASTLKNRDTPILIKQEYIYDIGSSPTTNTVNIPICIDSSEGNHCNFKLSTPSEIQVQDPFKNSPKLLSFMPPNGQKSGILINEDFRFSETINNSGVVNLVFNQHEPLGVNSETNIENNEIIKSDKQSIYEDLGQTAKFHSELSNCNESLAKLVNMMNNTNESSMISVSIDNYTGGEDYEDYVYDEFNSNNQIEDEVKINELYSKTALQMHELRKLNPKLNYSIKLLANSKPPLGFRDPVKIKNSNNCMNNTFNTNISPLDTTSTSVYTLNPVEKNANILIGTNNIIKIDKNFV